MKTIVLMERKINMIKKIAWDVFKKTGNINTFMEFRKINEIEKNNIYNTNIEQEKSLYENEIENTENKKWQT